MPKTQWENTTLCSPRASASSSDVNKDPTLATTSPILVTTPLLPNLTDLPPNHVLLKVHHFGFSANNVTYQALGEHPHFRYFDFHPAPESKRDGVSPKTHGLIPVWGFATVIASSHPKIIVGERVYGYLCPTQYLLLPVSPNDVNKHAFYAPRPHLPADRRPYNQILRCTTDPHYRPEYEELTMLYRPLFWTSYWFEDYLYTRVSAYSSSLSSSSSSSSEGKTHNTPLVILISSASSKTAFCLAYLIQQRMKMISKPSSPLVVGLTSAKNVAFTKGLGLYTDVYAYTDDLERILSNDDDSGGRNRTREWIYVDVAGNDQLNSRLQSYFAASNNKTTSGGNRVIKAVSLGMTNLSPATTSGSHQTTMATTAKEWQENTFSSVTTDETTGSGEMLNLEPFFMPEWLAVRRNQLTPVEIFERQNTAWHTLMRDCQNWVKLETVRGAEEVKRAYERLVKDGLGPEKGLVWSMLSEAEEGGRDKVVKSRL